MRSSRAAAFMFGFTATYVFVTIVKALLTIGG